MAETTAAKNFDSIYADIAKRTGSNIYISVVGPVRTGKSTFIKRFMTKLVIPNIEGDYKRARAQDELPQSAAGRTVMTAEPKFIPEEAAKISLNGVSANVRLVDCVGYMIPSALGQFENDAPRMVRTPWSENEMPMTEAAELGTRKVIAEHTTAGIVMTTDGSVTDFPASEYTDALDRVMAEVKASEKPFVLVLNTREPNSDEAKAAAAALGEKYDISALALNALSMEDDDISRVFSALLDEFPLRRADVFLPDWCDALPGDHPIKRQIFGALLSAATGRLRMRQADTLGTAALSCESVSNANVNELRMNDGSAKLDISIPSKVFYGILREQTGFDVSGETSLLPLLTELAATKRSWEKISNAMREVEQKGYGIVVPGIDELKLEKPELVKQGTRFGVKLTASAPSIHMLRADIKTTVSPVVGSEKQSEDLVAYLLSEFEGDESKIWESNIFGKSLHELVNEGLASKLNHMPEDARGKLRETLERIINEGSAGLICIIL